MIRQDGSISFASEIVALVDQFVKQYEALKGPLESDLERGLVITYLLSVIRCDIELLGECLSNERVFGDLPPDQVLDECTQASEARLDARREEILSALRQEGWLPLNTKEGETAA